MLLYVCTLGSLELDGHPLTVAVHCPEPHPNSPALSVESAFMKTVSFVNVVPDYSSV